jgi:uncharacterized Zn finger protein (UPF0148 family)
MGVIDQTIHTVFCPQCGTSESVKIIQHGSAFGGTWQSSKPMSNFTATWGNPSTLTGPQITAIKCNACGATPNVDVS